MFARFNNSWELVKSSARVLAADRELLIFPILSGIGAFLVTITFIVPFLIGDLLDSLLSSELEIVGLIIAFIYYVVLYTVIFFANTALVGAATIRLQGGNPTVGDGFAIATKNFASIFGYAIIAATVGVILNQISERSKGFGRFLVSLVGLAWNVATFLVVPVLAVEGVGPVEAVKRSAGLLKETWGEQIAGNLGVGAVTGLAVLAAFLGGGGLIAGAVALELSRVLIAALAVMLLLSLVVIGLVSSALKGVYTAAVYQYVKTGQAGNFFDQRLVENAFRLKG